MAEKIAELFAQADAAEAQLRDLAAGIRAARRQRDGMVEAGRLLLKAKAILAHGEWRMWLNQIGLPYAYAVQAIRLARLSRAGAQRWKFKDAAE